MDNFAILVVPLVAGILAGYTVRRNSARAPNITRVAFATIAVLIFLLGFSIGSNNDVLSSLPKVGWNALLIAVLSIIFSIAIVKLVRRKVNLE